MVKPLFRWLILLEVRHEEHPKKRVLSESLFPLDQTSGDKTWLATNLVTSKGQEVSLCGPQACAAAPRCYSKLLNFVGKSLLRRLPLRATEQTRGDNAYSHRGDARPPAQ